MSKENYLLKQQQKEKERLSFQRQKKLKKILLIFIGVLILGGSIFALSKIKIQPTPSEAAIISSQGIHWHPEIKISILGKNQEIPARIGLGLAENPIHTHDASGVIHLEFSGVVKEGDIKLGQFFQVWGKRFNKDCIFDKCSGPEGKLKILVNGEPNFEFENYAMQDKDKIEIIFE
mgnify:CR=1 FL=1